MAATGFHTICDWVDVSKTWRGIYLIKIKYKLSYVISSLLHTPGPRN